MREIVHVSGACRFRASSQLCRALNSSAQRMCSIYNASCHEFMNAYVADRVEGHRWVMARCMKSSIKLDHISSASGDG